ncbi:polysaccharide lyase family 8 super-sandwich domain-containing protein [Mariniflexile ostreae]|uniref:Polysaccharide lyase family 8 super-sandwich domain-containing protein n=1 Tax=Mariniflexile ostreae TaxID=1520892 RepID=A0ABV5FBQ5_9FLAO
MNKILIIVFAVFFNNQCFSQEVLFANYFDIETNQKEGSEVFGKVNLKRNKDFLDNTIPKSYRFSLENNASVFEISTVFDSEGRIFGVLKVAPGKKTGKSPEEVSLKVVLKEGNSIVASKAIVVHVVEKTMWQELVDVYSPVTTTVSRLYGRKKISDKELEGLLNDIESSHGKFSFSSIYTKHPSDYKNAKAYDKDLEKVTNTIGSLGFAYSKSKKYGINSDDSKSRERLKKAIYAASLAFMNSIPIYGKDLVVDGTPVGTEVGDGFSKLGNYASHGLLTHQWRATDALAAPLVHVWPEVLEDIATGNAQAQQLYDAVIRYYQLFFSVVPERRRMDDESQRWQNISDTNYSEGAWADANIGHRMRTLMVMPILWADYNRPITYVPYWYDDYYNGTEFEGLTFADDWTPNGVVADVRSWCDKLSLPSHRFNQSGFHPDGTVTHHRGHNASDVAMVAYGFEWLTTVNSAINYFKNTALPIENENYQFITDRLNYTYRRMLYKNAIDYVVAGRSFFSDLSDFGTNHVNKSIENLLEGKSPTTFIENEEQLKELKKDLEQGRFTHTETTAFWNADYLMHRREDGDQHYYFSVKQKSLRTSGAEDFSNIRKSWHAGSGVFQLRVNGDEYNQNVLANYDWHTLPGVTEAWRTDAMPTGPASASLPGGNDFSGILADGLYGLTGYHHKPIDTYTAVEALKSYHLIGRFGTAIGSGIQRKKASTNLDEIVTTIDQSAQTHVITYSANSTTKRIELGESVDVKEALLKPTWVHHNNKGYLIFPKKNQNLLIKTGEKINITATDLNIEKSSNYILALDHGIHPTQGDKEGYHYVLVANVSAKEMPKVLEDYEKQNQIITKEESYHALFNPEQKLKQVVFYKASRVDFSDKSWVQTNLPALVMMEHLKRTVRLTLVDPLHSLETKSLTVQVSEILKEGEYTYTLPGIKPREGEKAVVTNNGNYSTITIMLPDNEDGAFYDYREQMYAGAPIVLDIDKK